MKNVPEIALNTQPVFKCQACGSCCRQLDIQSSDYKYLDRGNGVCLYFNDEANLCQIYEDRPEICRVDQQYKNFADYLTVRQYLALNYFGCRALRANLRNRVSS